jgi:biotin operon repressor
LSEDNLKDWVKKELVSSTGLAERILTEYKEAIKNLLSITNEGKIIVHKSDLSAKQRIGLYLIGAAYAKVAELRKDDLVSNKEIVDELKIKKGTVDPTMKKLRDEGLAIQKDDGLHHVNYSKLKNLMAEFNV